MGEWRIFCSGKAFVVGESLEVLPGRPFAVMEIHFLL